MHFRIKTSNGDRTVVVKGEDKSAVNSLHVNQGDVRLCD